LGSIAAFLTLTRVGLIVSSIGTLMVAVSFGKNPGDANQEDEEGRTVYLASLLHPRLFRWGLWIVILGFLLQFLA
jgi:hypothetical protein